ncbi:MAG: ABC transporter permease [Proteobacteria bacterium]|nr:ABC transporter permease [Pseudomonadota bacterium]
MSTSASTTNAPRGFGNRALIDPIVFFVLLLGLWELGVRGFAVKSYLLPAPSEIVRAAWDARATLAHHTWVTFEEVVLGFVLATVLGVAAAAAIFFIPIFRRTLYPLLIALQSIPKVGLAPIVVVWLGYGLSSKVLMTMLFALFPILIATLGGFSSTPESLVEHFTALRATTWQTLWRLRIPSALPHFVDGCKVAMPLAVIGAVVGEFIGSYEGLGNLIMLASGASNTGLTFAALGAVTLLSLVLFYVIEALGRLIWWQSR